MNDLERERNFYRDQYNDLGKRVLRLTEEQTRASRQARRSQTTATLIRNVYRQLVRSAVPMDEISEQFLWVISETLSVDRAALFRYKHEKECFVLQHSLDFPQEIQIDFGPSHLPKEFYSVNSSSSPCDPILESLRRAAGVPYLLWLFDPLAGIALLVGNATEDQHLHRPFEENDREIIKSALDLFIEIVERRRLEEELTKAQKLESIGLLAGGIAHDFNNILTTIVMNTQIVRMQLEKGANIVKHLDGLEKAAQRATALTRQLLTFAKGEAPIREIASISESLKDTVIFALRGSSVRCEFSIVDDLWLAKVDTSQISQVINNLVINAKEAMPKGGTIKIKAENLTVKDDKYLPVPKGSYIKLSIEDQGIGIQKGHLLKILDPFFTTKHKGSGLGLAIVHSIIKKHGGYIDVQSELEAGTCFTIFLPAEE